MRASRRGWGARPAASLITLVVLLVLVSTAALGAAHVLLGSRLPATALLHLRLELGPLSTGRQEPMHVDVRARDTPPSPAPAPNAPSAVIPPGLGMVHVPILEYHYIRVNPNPRDRLGFNLSVTPTNFQAQMNWLAAHGYHPVDVSDLRAYFSDQVALPAKPVVLTFDDGYRDFYTSAWPVLQARGFTAVSYVVPGFLGAKSYMTRAQVIHLDRAGVDIGSHTVNHADLTKLDATTLRIELEASKGYLEQLLGHPVLDFCYPSGRFNPAVEAAVEAAGYQSATTEVRGSAHSWTDRLTWTRVRVQGGEPLSAFAASLGPSDPAVSLPAPPAASVGPSL